MNGSYTVTGNWNTGDANRTRVCKVAAADPGTCTVGDCYYNTAAAAGHNWKLCTTPNVWTEIVGSGAAMGFVTASGAPGANQIAKFTSATDITGSTLSDSGTIVTSTTGSFIDANTALGFVFDWNPAVSNSTTMSVRKNGVAQLTVDSDGHFLMNPISATAGNNSALFDISAPTETGVTTEKPGLRSRGGTLTLTGTYGTQRFNRFGIASITAASPFTVTDAATVAIEGAPTQAGSATVTNKYSLWVQGGESRLAGNLGIDPGADSTAEYKIVADPDGVCNQNNVLMYTAATGGITCQPLSSTGVQCIPQIAADGSLETSTLCHVTSAGVDLLQLGGSGAQGIIPGGALTLGTQIWPWVSWLTEIDSDDLLFIIGGLQRLKMASDGSVLWSSVPIMGFDGATLSSVPVISAAGAGASFTLKTDNAAFSATDRLTISGGADQATATFSATNLDMGGGAIANVVSFASANQWLANTAFASGGGATPAINFSSDSQDYIDTDVFFSLTDTVAATPTTVFSVNGEGGMSLGSSGVDFVVDKSGRVNTGTWQAAVIATNYGGTGLTSVTTGDLLYGSAANTWSALADVATGNVLKSGGVGVAPAWGNLGALYTLTSDDTDANSTTKTDLTNAGGIGSKVLPANYFTAGKTIRVVARGRYGTALVPGNITLDFDLVSSTPTTVTVATTGSVAAPAVSLTNQYFECSLLLTCRTTGTTGTVQSQGFCSFSTAAGTSLGYEMVETGTRTVNTTLTEEVKFSMTWATANAANTITVSNATVEALN